MKLQVWPLELYMCTFIFPIAVGNHCNALKVLMSASRRLTLPNEILHIKSIKAP